MKWTTFSIEERKFRIRGLLDKLLMSLHLPTFRERDELAREVSLQRAFAEQMVKLHASDAIVVGSDGVTISNITLQDSRRILIVPGVRNTVIQGIFVVGSIDAATAAKEGE